MLVNMDINNKSVVELKAIAFDTLVEIERHQKNLQVINQMIAKKLEEEKVEGEKLAKK